jgi:desulfoferrodoxin (superoxide reductase-like protein)
MKRVSVTRRNLLKASGFAAIAATAPAWVWGCRGESEQGPEPAQPEPMKPPPATGGESEAGNDDWEAKAAQLEKRGVFTIDNPGKWAGKEKAHVPIIRLDQAEGKVTVFTDHPMSPAHYITTHYVKDQDGRIFGLKSFTGRDEKAESVFRLPPGTVKITAYSDCNLHGNWSSESAVG